MNFRLPWIFLILFQLLVGCADQHLAYDQLIVGGVEIKNAGDVSSYLVNINVADEFGRPAVCTGVFVSSNAILTAAHCASDQLDNLSVTFRLSDFDETGAVVNLTIIDSKKIEVGQDVREDLVLLTFKENIPHQAKIAKISSLNSLESNSLFLVAGYGMHAEEKDVMNTKLKYDDKPRMKSILTSKTTNFENYFLIDQKSSQGGVCLGDSGGPAFYLDKNTKQMLLIGIASAVSHQDKFSNCLNESYFIKTDFLKEKVN